MLMDKRKEVLRLYREILRTARQFEWPNEQGQPWYVRRCRRRCWHGQRLRH
jgi:hypothetical protein